MATPLRRHSTWHADHRVLPFEIDTERAFTALFGDAETAFWLDGGLAGAQASRFSFLGCADGPWSEVLRYRVGSGLVSGVRSDDGDSRRDVQGTMFEVLESRLAERVVGGIDPLPFTAGYVGFFGYEVKADCGSANITDSAGDDSAWVFADRFIAVDHLEKLTYVVAAAPCDADLALGQTWISETAAALAALDVSAAEPLPTQRVADVVCVPDVERWLVREHAQYLADVETCLEALRAGDSYQVCLTNTAVLPTAADPLDHYRAMRRRNLGSYSSFLRFGRLSIASSSPECFLRIDGSDVIESKPIKGTVARGVDPTDDARRRDDLAADPKSRAENLMIVDLLRNDLGQVCSVGSVSVPDLMAVETYANVHHLVSTIRGHKRPDVSSVRAVQQCFPPGSMTGAPKLRSMEILGRLENRLRGPYSGALGYFSLTGEAELSVVIRTAVFDGSGAMTVGAGGAIVLDSKPEEEFAEMLTKMATPLAGMC